jgi:hypothetical protein
MIPECVQFSRRADRVPEEHTSEIFAADSADKPSDERMRNRDARNWLDVVDFEYMQVGDGNALQ